MKSKSRLYSRMQKKKVQHSSAIKNNDAQLFLYLNSLLLISMVGLDQRSAAKISVSKMRLDTFVLFNIFHYCRFASFSEFAFHCFN